ncbi:GTP pyrophosphokinase [Akkermansia muciniphila]|uniref:GTP pyrophosphokinase n=1 Tax=Akkermansia muciniphila TaxID=239935 RepID=UPI000C9A8E75|nr:hypothetical protein [Akkermansia muciniphila]PNC04647.1 hypothetical protein CXU21_11655 [Akkermansia muciniphila]
MVDTSQIVQRWREEKPQLEKLGQDVVVYLKQEIFKKELHPEITYRTKEIHSLIKKIQKKQREKCYEYDDVKDRLGIRIICPFLCDLEIIDSFLKDFFIIRKEEKKKDSIDFNRLDYQSNHYDVSIKKRLFSYDENFVFEIQVRTMNQHAWANSAHILYYKQDITLSDEMKHRIYRLLSLYELADEEFDKVNEYLKSQNYNLNYALLRRLEGKLYKFAQSDYDREWAIKNINIILSFLTENEKTDIDCNIDIFIDSHELKIQHIYDDNRERYSEIPLLTQPEIFVIWYGIEKFPFSIRDNWYNLSDEEELDIIKTLWC